MLNIALPCVACGQLVAKCHWHRMFAWHTPRGYDLWKGADAEKTKQRKRKLHDILEQQLRPHEASTDSPQAGHDMHADAFEGANSDKGEI